MPKQDTQSDKSAYREANAVEAGKETKIYVVNTGGLDELTKIAEPVLTDAQRQLITKELGDTKAADTVPVAGKPSRLNDTLIIIVAKDGKAVRAFEGDFHPEHLSFGQKLGGFVKTTRSVPAEVSFNRTLHLAGALDDKVTAEVPAGKISRLVLEKKVHNGVMPTPEAATGFVSDVSKALPDIGKAEAAARAKRDAAKAAEEKAKKSADNADYKPEASVDSQKEGGVSATMIASLPGDKTPSR